MSRYWTLVLVTLAVVIILEYTLPSIWTVLGQMGLPWRSPFVEISLILGTFIICYILGEPIKIRRARPVDCICYPPIWSSIVFGVLLICVHEQWLQQSLLTVNNGWYQAGGLSRSWFVLAAALAAIICRWTKSVLDSPRDVDDRETNHAHEMPKSKRWIDAGEQPIKGTNEDLFSRTEIASRIVKHVQNDERSIALIGSVGSGKSSILNLACESIKKESPTVIIVRSDIWRARDAKSMPQLVIDDIVRTLDGIVDTTGIRDLSLTYARFVAAEPSGYLRGILGAYKRSDSLHQLDRLCSILDALDRRLILIIDDIDRIHEGFNVVHISRFLWALREIDKCVSVIAMDPDRTNLDYHKLCDSVENVPSIPIPYVAEMLGELYRHWTSVYDDIDPHLHREVSDKFELGRMHKLGAQEYFDSEIHSVPLRMLATLLTTPRSLKHVLHRIDEVWNELHGEVEIDDLIILSTLRHSAPAIYQFIVTNIKIARKTSDGFESGILEDFGTRWNEVLEREQDYHKNAVRRLVDLLGVEQLRAPAPNPGATGCPQGVHSEGHPDYLSRITTGQIREDEVRDQIVLRDIAKARQGNRPIIARRLVRSMELGDDYCSIWERFHALDPEEFIGIVDDVIDLLIEQHGPEIDPNHPLLTRLSDKSRRESILDHDWDAEEWLSSRASGCVHKSLNLACGLLRFCLAVRNRLQDDDYKGHLAEIILRQISTRIQSYGQLTEALSTEHPTTASILLGHISNSSKSRETRFVSLLIDGAEMCEPKIILQLADILAGSPSLRGTGSTNEIVDANIDSKHLQILFAGKEASVLRALSLYPGSDPRYLGVARAARQELKSYVDR